MNFFTKNRIVFWVLIFLVIVNLSALIAFFTVFSKNTPGEVQRPQPNAGMAFRKELSLSADQSEKVEAVLADYRTITRSVIANIRDCRAQLLDELAKDEPDTNVVNQCGEKICLWQKQMQKASVQQYLALKKICNTEQCQRLSAIYFELYGFSRPGKGMGRGKGMMHQYRKGQGQ
jgi:hypothetical protein